jgi:hypothetical protein
LTEEDKRDLLLMLFQFICGFAGFIFVLALRITFFDGLMILGLEIIGYSIFIVVRDRKLIFIRK